MGEAGMGRLTEREAPVLRALNEHTLPYGERCVPFHYLSGEPKDAPATKEVRRVVRQLARKGMAELHRGLINEYDGTMCGSGHCITPAGRSALSQEGQG